MPNTEKLTPRLAGEISTQDYTQHRLAVAAIAKAHEVINRSITDAEDPELGKLRHDIAVWHVEWWRERQLPESVEQLAIADRKAERHYQSNQAAYYKTAVAEALLDGIEITRSK